MKGSMNMTSEDDAGRGPISTLVFMDLEATGLPSFIGKKNVHITEMCFVAVDRLSFEVDKSLRVLNKLSLCIRPRYTISPTAMTMTGLYNDVLEKQEKFDDSIPKLLEYFFRRLRKPICLLAHNGNRYDFPLLQAELRNINYALDPQILCADTLQAIKFIVSNPVIPEVDLEASTEAKPENSRNGNDPDVEILLSQDMDIFNDIKEPNEEPNMTPKCHSNNLVQHQTVSLIHMMNDEQTPNKHIASESISTNPRKKAKLNPSLLLDNHKNGTSTNFNPSHARRQLFPDATSAHIAPSKPVQFSLEKLYNHFFGKSPTESHYAEADCIALSQVCQHVNKDFLKWIDENCSSFCETKAMW